MLTLQGNTFTADTIITNWPGLAPNSRVIELGGTITDGPQFQPTRARMTLNFNQVGGAGTSVGYGASIVTLAVPEPASMAMLGTGMVGLLGYARRRKAKATA